MSKFGSFGLVDAEYQRILVLHGNTHELNEKLANIWYKNLMFDTRAYKDLVTLWIKGFPTLHFEIEVKREQLELLQVRFHPFYHCYFIIKARDTSLASGKVNEKISIIIKTYRRHNCLDRLVDSIRKYYPYISIIIADDSPGNGATGEF